MMLVVKTAAEKTPQNLEKGDSSAWFRLAMSPVQTMPTAMTEQQISS
jgi:hypothetical protein